MKVKKTLLWAGDGGRPHGTLRCIAVRQREIFGVCRILIVEFEIILRNIVIPDKVVAFSAFLSKSTLLD